MYNPCKFQPSRSQGRILRLFKHSLTLVQAAEKGQNLNFLKLGYFWCGEAFLKAYLTKKNKLWY